MIKISISFGLDVRRWSTRTRRRTAPRPRRHPAVPAAGESPESRVDGLLHVLALLRSDPPAQRGRFSVGGRRRSARIEPDPDPVDDDQRHARMSLGYSAPTGRPRQGRDAKSSGSRHAQRPGRPLPQEHPAPGSPRGGMGAPSPSSRTSTSSPGGDAKAVEHRLDKVRNDPGNYADKKRFAVRDHSDAGLRPRELLRRCTMPFSPAGECRSTRSSAARCESGTNHGSLSDRIRTTKGNLLPRHSR